MSPCLATASPTAGANLVACGEIDPRQIQLESCIFGLKLLRVVGRKRLAQFDFPAALPFLSRRVPRRKRASARSGLICSAFLIWIVADLVSFFRRWSRAEASGFSGLLSEQLAVARSATRTAAAVPDLLHHAWLHATRRYAHPRSTQSSICDRSGATGLAPIKKSCNTKGPWRAFFAEVRSSTLATTNETEPCQSEPHECQRSGLGHSQGGRHIVLFT